MNSKIAGASATRYQDLVRILFVVLTGLQLADWDSTVRGIQMGRQEQNMLIEMIGRHVGILAAVTLTKITALLLTWWYLKMAAKRDSKAVLLPLALVTSVYAVIVLNNYF